MTNIVASNMKNEVKSVVRTKSKHIDSLSGMLT